MLEAVLLVVAVGIIVVFGALGIPRRRRAQRAQGDHEVAHNTRPHPGGFSGSWPSQAPIPGPHDPE